ncbi:hypothetical protein GCM10010448_60640 [Streptomyces glomeratus]|uniref:Uncharacterized protein n=1 Tax=Streptomyces glomeratus TaxID=284452 RepID=A0ABP6M2U7_9ACTN
MAQTFREELLVDARDRLSPVPRFRHDCSLDPLWALAYDLSSRWESVLTAVTDKRLSDDES